MSAPKGLDILLFCQRNSYLPWNIKRIFILPTPQYQPNTSLFLSEASRCLKLWRVVEAIERKISQYFHNSFEAEMASSACHHVIDSAFLGVEVCLELTSIKLLERGSKQMVSGGHFWGPWKIHLYAINDRPHQYHWWQLSWKKAKS